MTVTINGTTGITTPALDSDGTIKLDGNYPVGTNNVALGNTALSNGSLSGGNNTAVGYNSGANIAGGAGNTLTGSGAGVGITTGTNNSYFGVGTAAFDYNTGTANVGLGYQALYKITTASNNTAVGYQAGYNITTGISNSAFGREALFNTTTSNYNSAFGPAAGYTNDTGENNTYLGFAAGYSATGSRNTFVGARNGTLGSGQSMTTGNANTILGGYSGNQGGLDIRTASNHIVLSDGDGNPRVWVTNSNVFYAPGIYENTSVNAANVVAYGSGGDIYRSTSSARYKTDIQDSTRTLDDLLKLRPVTYKNINPNIDKGQTFGGLIAEEVHDAGLTEFVMYNEDNEPESLAYGNMVSLCINAIKEQQATITALTARITALEGA